MLCLSITASPFIDGMRSRSRAYYEPLIVSIYKTLGYTKTLMSLFREY